MPATILLGGAARQMHRAGNGDNGMDFQIVKTKQYPPNLPADHARIIEVEVLGGTRFAVSNVVAWIDAGTYRFWVKNPDTGSPSWVHTYQMTPAKRHIRTEPNSTKKDNLDSLPTYS